MTLALLKPVMVTGKRFFNGDILHLLPGLPVGAPGGIGAEEALRALGGLEARTNGLRRVWSSQRKVERRFPREHRLIKRIVDLQLRVFRSFGSLWSGRGGSRGRERPVGQSLRLLRASAHRGKTIRKPTTGALHRKNLALALTNIRDLIIKRVRNKV